MAQDWLVAPGYEPVRDAFIDGQGSFGLGGGAYCAYVGGQPVVDLWGGTARLGRAWDAGTTTVLMSASKGFAALCVQLLIDKGHVDLDTRVAEIWPEFAQNGKGETRIRHFVQHTAGVLGYSGQTSVTRLDGTGWDSYEAIAAGLAGCSPAWAPGTRHGYHALSVGWLLAEVVRRVSGRSLGQYFQEEVAAPLSLEAWIGTPAEELTRVAHVYPMRTAHLPKILQRTHEAINKSMRDPNTLLGLAFLAEGHRSGLDEVEVMFNNPDLLAAEFPAGGATANARALARLWAVMAGGGELDSLRLLSPEITKAWSSVIQNEPDYVLAGVSTPRLTSRMTTAPVPRTVGYLGNSTIPGLGGRFGPNPEAYGAEGLGGQYGFCDPTSAIAVGYVRSELALMDVLQARLTRTLYDCARAQGHAVFTPPAKKRRAVLIDNTVGAYLRRRVTVPSP